MPVLHITYGIQKIRPGPPNFSEFYGPTRRHLQYKSNMYMLTNKMISLMMADDNVNVIIAHNYFKDNVKFI